MLEIAQNSNKRVQYSENNFQRFSMTRLKIVGMTCAACSARVEHALNAIQGVDFATVNFLTNTAKVDGTVSTETLIQSIRQLGYDAFLEEDDARTTRLESNPNLEKNRQSLKRLVISLTLAFFVFYLSTCALMFHCPLPKFLTSVLANGVVQFLLASTIISVNRQIFIDGLQSLSRQSPNMNSLVAIGAGASYLFSVVLLFIDVTTVITGDTERSKSLLHGLYFESASIILAVISLGRALETLSKGKTSSAIRKLTELAPPMATVVRGGKEITINASETIRGDVFVVRPGTRIPADGVIVEGSSAVDESALTGESVPIDKKVGSYVSAGTLNVSGFLRCRAEKVGKETTLAQIIQLTIDATESKAPVARLADRISAVFVPIIIGIATITFVAWLSCGQTIEFALLRAVAVLLISCPCALGLATPAAIIVGMGLGARHGILFKSSEALENLGKSQIIALDKTGVVTKGTPSVTDVSAASDVEEQMLLSVATALEAKSEHPFGKAIVEYAKSLNVPLLELEVDDFRAISGVGVEGRINGKTVLGGKLNHFERLIELPSGLRERVETLGIDGKTSLLFALDGKFLGLIAVADKPKSLSATAIQDLKKILKTRVVMLTGDSRRVGESVGKQVGIDEIYADLLPADKEVKVREFSALGRVAFVGDGINDAPALSRADVGVAVGAGTNVAIDAADVVLVNNELNDLCRAIRLSRATLTNIKENLFWAFFYNILGIPLAAGVFAPLLGWTLDPVFGALAMSLSSVCVVSNALRLNFAQIDKSRKLPINVSYHNYDNSTIKESNMAKQIKIDGMMCKHCEANVKKTLESLSFVSSAVVNHLEGTAVVELQSVPSDVDAKLKNAVESLGYVVNSVE